MHLKDLFEEDNTSLPDLIKQNSSPKSRKEYLSSKEQDSLPIKKQILEKQIDLICSYASNAYNSENHIYKGMTISRKSNIMYLDTIRLERKSRNTSNYFTALTTILPSWEGWPRRSHCLVCTNGDFHAKNYGNTYVVLPFDNTNIAVAAASDIWGSFDALKQLFNKKYININRFNDIFAELLSVFSDIPYNYPYIINSTNIGDILHYMDDVIISIFSLDENNKNLQNLKDIIVDYFRPGIIKDFVNGKTFTDIMNHYLDPAYNDNSIKTTNNIPNNYTREIWFEGKCFLVREKHFKMMKGITA